MTFCRNDEILLPTEMTGSRSQRSGGHENAKKNLNPRMTTFLSHSPSKVSVSPRFRLTTGHFRTLVNSRWDSQLAEKKGKESHKFANSRLKLHVPSRFSHQRAKMVLSSLVGSSLTHTCISLPFAVSPLKTAAESMIDSPRARQ